MKTAKGETETTDMTKPDPLQNNLAKLKQKVSVLLEKAKMTRERIEKISDSSDTETVPRRAVVERSRCTACGICRENCPHNAIRITYIAQIDTDKCTGCGTCVDVCPRGAIRLAATDEDSAKIAEI